MGRRLLAMLVCATLVRQRRNLAAGAQDACLAFELRALPTPGLRAHAPMTTWSLFGDRAWSRSCSAGIADATNGRQYAVNARGCLSLSTCVVAPPGRLTRSMSVSVALYTLAPLPYCGVLLSTSRATTLKGTQTALGRILHRQALRSGQPILATS